MGFDLGSFLAAPVAGILPTAYASSRSNGASAAPAAAPQQQSWIDAMNQGRAAGRETFNDAGMQDLLARRQQLAQGYDGTQLGALRAGARAETTGAQNQALRGMQSTLGRQGVGGARAAAIQGAAQQKYTQQSADNERKMALDNAQLQRQGLDSVQDLQFRQKLGELATGLGYGQLAVSQNTANAATDAANKQTSNGGLFGGLLGGLFG